jgi:ClpP class serine protease
VKLLAGYTPGYGDILWTIFLLWFVLASMTPYIRMRQLQAARLELIRRLQRRLGAKVITMIHRQERISFLGIPIHRYISIEDSEEILRAIRSTPPDTPIALIIHTPGGLVLAASQIARALHRHPGRKIVIVPHYAMSGGTLIALAADEIWMDPNAVLGPVDPQISAGGKVYPAPSIVKVAELKGDKASDDTLILADVARKALDQMRRFVRELISDKIPPERVDEVVERLVSGYYTHDYPITVEELERLGFTNIKTELPPEVYELMDLYPQEHTIRPGVEYVPGAPLERRHSHAPTQGSTIS